MKKVYVLIFAALLMGGITGLCMAATSAADESWESVFRTQASENLEEAIGKALQEGIPSCDLTATALELRLNPYNVLLEIFKVYMDPEEKKALIEETVRCAQMAEISPAIINQALIDAGADPELYGLGYTPPGGPRFGGGGVGGLGSTGRLGQAASPATP